ncbi:hypothetical protein X275_00765 [Marinitoga sp. 1197]|uniref:PQQ-binding-like beta-propeller repeat protein n=1 Tax=Marinitoga sp. 1197 TaxID=1428449 RepID=UPI000657C3C6|nr:PQQ-binding-like beta-propeller repeat protein [Marinitoga sp. 1197]KLO24249.1 hypothetical protein X275_00765 [Marinitoga sp. 1197]
MDKIIVLALLIAMIAGGLIGGIINNNPPLKATEVYPLNNSENIELNPTLKWEGYDIENGSNIKYDIYFGNDKNNLKLIEKDYKESTYKMEGLAPITKYYWKIDSIDSRGAKTEGDIWEFKTKENTPPTTPEIIEPYNNAKNVSLNPTLKWKSIDIDGHNIKYDIYFGEDKNNLKLMKKGYDGIAYKIEGLEVEKTYYWKIDSIDSLGAKTEGDIWEFKTKENTPPTTPEIIEPENGAENVSLIPTLKWKSIDIDGHNITYDIYFGEDKNNLKLIAKDYEESKYKIEDLDTITKYYWKIIAKDRYGGIAESTIANFTTSLLKWKFKTNGSVYSSPAIGADGTIYVGSYDNYIYAINPDGSLKWKFETEALISSSPAIGADGTIYVGSYDNYIYAINPDGSLKWKFETGEWVKSSPAIGTDGTVFVGSYDNYIYAINPDGSLKWKFETGSDVASSPAIGADGTVFVGSYDNYIYAINPDGSLKWKFETGSDVASSPAIGADGTIYVGSYDNYIYAINPDGSLKWKFETGSDVASSPAIGADNTIYIGSKDGYMYTINPDGSLKWKFETGDWVASSPAIGADGSVFVSSYDNYIYAINPDGSLKGNFRTADWVKSSPAIGSDGTIYIGSKDGYIYAIKGNNGGLSDTPWPMFHANPQHSGRVDEDNYLTSEFVEKLEKTLLIVNDKDDMDSVSIEFKKIMEEEKKIDIADGEDIRNGNVNPEDYGVIACFIYGGEDKVSNIDESVANKILEAVETGSVFITNNEAGGAKLLSLMNYVNSSMKSGWFPALNDSFFITEARENDPLFENVNVCTEDPHSHDVSYWNSGDYDSLIFRIDNNLSYTGRYGIIEYIIDPDEYLAKGFHTGWNVNDETDIFPQWNVGKGRIIITTYLLWTFDQENQTGGYIGKAGRDILHNIAKGALRSNI